MTSVTISADDARSIRAVELAAEAGQWIRIHSNDGRKSFGIRSSRDRNHVYLVTQASCTCGYGEWHGGESCKHQLAVRLYCELVKAQEARPARRKTAWERHEHANGEVVYLPRQTRVLETVRED